MFKVFIVNFEHISHIVLLFQFLTLSKQIPAGSRWYGHVCRDNGWIKKHTNYEVD